MTASIGAATILAEREFIFNEQSIALYEHIRYTFHG